MFLGGLMLCWWNFLMTRIRISSALRHSVFRGNNGNREACSTVVESLKKRLLLCWWTFFMTCTRVSASTHSGFGGDGGNGRACSTVVESLKKRLTDEAAEVIRGLSPSGDYEPTTADVALSKGTGCLRSPARRAVAREWPKERLERGRQR